MSRQSMLILAALYLLLLTAVATAQTYPPVSAIPDQDQLSGRFMNLTRGFSSLGESGTRIEMDIPMVDGFVQTDFVLSIFDGDVYNVVRDANGVSYFADGTPGYWDPVGNSLTAAKMPQVIYSLYANPDGIGTPVLLHTWGSWEMPNADWWIKTVAHDPAAFNVDRNCYQYRLCLDWEDQANPTQPNAQNNFKIAVTGNLRLIAHSIFGFIGYTSNDPAQHRFPGPTTYNGDWTFNLRLPQDVTRLELWTGDFDNATDSEDPLSPDTPAAYYQPQGIVFHEPVVKGILQKEGAYIGAPADNAPVGSPLRMGDAISMKISSPAGSNAWSYGVPNPSGDREWEATFISNDASDLRPAHLQTSLPAGLYQWDIKGADGRNTLFLSANMEIAPANAQIGDLVWLDENKNGLQDVDEPGMPDVLVRLYMLDGQLMSEQVTDENGKYLFTGLPFDTYEVEFVLPNGYRWTEGLVGTNRAVDSDIAQLQNIQARSSDVADLSYNSINLTHDAGLIVGMSTTPELELSLTGNKLGANTRTIGFWKNNVSKHMANKPIGTQVARADLLLWIKAVRGFSGSGIFGETDKLMKLGDQSETELLKATLAILDNGSSDAKLKLRCQLMATELNMVSGLFNFSDNDLLQAFCQQAEDALLSNASTATLSQLHVLSDQINNEGHNLDMTLGVGRFVGYTLYADGYNMPGDTKYVVTLPLDTGMTFVSATLGGEYDAKTHSVKWSLVMPPGNSSFDLSCATRISASAAGNVSLAGDIEDTIYSNWQTLDTTIGAFTTRGVTQSPF